MIRRILAAAAAAAVLAGCNPKVESSATSAPSPSPTPTGLALRISGRGTANQPVRIVQTYASGNLKEYELIARSYEEGGPQGSYLATFKDVRVTFYGKDGSTLTANAPTAVLDQSKKTIRMTGGVKATSSSGTHLTCDQLLYNHATHMVYGSGHVVITRGGFRASGSTFRSDVSLTHAQMR